MNRYLIYFGIVIWLTGCEKEFGPKPVDHGFFQKVYGNGLSGQLVSGITARQFPQSGNIEILKEGNMIGIGSLVDAENPGASNIYVFKTDGKGFITREVIFSPRDSVVCQAVDLKVVEDGFMVGGTVTSGTRDSVVNELYLVRLDNDLNIQWDSLYSILEITGTEQSGELKAMLVSSYDEIVALGVFNHQGSENTMFLSYFDMEGNYLDDRTQLYEPDERVDELGNNILEINNNGLSRLVWTGTETKLSSPQISFIDAPYDGIIPAPRTIEDLSDRVEASCIQWIPLGFVIIGTMHKDGGDRDIRVIKTDNKGELSGHATWARNFTADKVEEGVDIDEAADGGYILLGSIAEGIDENRDFYLVKTDIHGDVEWEKQYGGPGDDIPSGIKATSRGYALIGTSEHAGSRVITIINMDRQGNIVQD